MVFENYVHSVLCDNAELATGDIGQLAKSPRRLFGNKPVTLFKFTSASPSALQHIPRNKYCRPEISNFPVLDGIFIPKRCSATNPVLAFQMTTSRRHGISYESCVQVLAALDARTDTDKSRGPVHVHLYFVTPVLNGAPPTVYTKQPFCFPQRSDGKDVRRAKRSLQEAINRGASGDVARWQLEVKEKRRTQLLARKAEQQILLVTSGIIDRVHQKHVLCPVASALQSLTVT
jgi:hypothetical protein